jgi:hypothetical protein
MTSHRTILLAILVTSLILRLVILYAVGEIQPYRDELRYLEAGRSIAAGEGIRYTNPLWDERHAAPLYPWFVGTVFWLGGGPFEVKLAQVFLGTATVGFAYLLGMSWFGPTVGLVSAAILGFYPTMIAFTHYNWNEVLFLFWLVPALGLVFERQGQLSRPGRLVLSGLLLGLAALTRPAMAFLVPLVPVWLVIVTRDLRMSALRSAFLVLGFVVAILPTTIDIYKKHGGFLLISSAPAVVWYRSYNFFDPPNPDWTLQDERNLLPQLAKALAAGKQPRPMVKESNPVLRVREEMHRGIRFALENPGLFFKQTRMRIVEFLNPTSFLIRHFRLGLYQRGPDGQLIRDPLPAAVQNVIIATTVASYMLVSVLAVLGVLCMPPGLQRSMIVMIVLFFILIHGLTVSMSRYRLGMLPVLAVSTAYLAVHFGACRDALRSPRRAGTAVVIILLLGVVWGIQVDRI